MLSLIVVMHFLMKIIIISCFFIVIIKKKLLKLLNGEQPEELVYYSLHQIIFIDETCKYIKNFMKKDVCTMKILLLSVPIMNHWLN